MAGMRPLDETKCLLGDCMLELNIKGTVILADEGFNGTVCGDEEHLELFVQAAESILDTHLVIKQSSHPEIPFRKIDVKIKPEIVTLKKAVQMEFGQGTHVTPDEWNRIIRADDVLVLDTRNDYEYRNGTFRGAINPKTEKFSDLPEFVDRNLDPTKHKRVAMFCTGGIRCEKFAPYMKSLGFENIYQLEGGILRYLAEVEREDSAWEGECFVFDERRTVDEKLEKGNGPDYSQPEQNR